MELENQDHGLGHNPRDSQGLPDDVLGNSELTKTETRNILTNYRDSEQVTPSNYNRDQDLVQDIKNRYDSNQDAHAHENAFYHKKIFENGPRGLRNQDHSDPISSRISGARNEDRFKNAQNPRGEKPEEPYANYGERQNKWGRGLARKDAEYAPNSQIEEEFAKNNRFSRHNDSPKHPEISSRQNRDDRLDSNEKVMKKTKSNSDESVKLLRKYCDTLKSQVGQQKDALEEQDNRISGLVAHVQNLTNHVNILMNKCHFLEQSLIQVRSQPISGINSMQSSYYLNQPGMMMSPMMNVPQMPGQQLFSQMPSGTGLNGQMNFSGPIGFSGQVEPINELSQTGGTKKPRKKEKSKWDERRVSDRSKEIRKAVDKELDEGEQRYKQNQGYGGEMELERVREEEKNEVESEEESSSGNNEEEAEGGNKQSDREDSEHESQDQTELDLKADPSPGNTGPKEADINQALLRALKAEKNTEILNFMADFEPEGKLSDIRETLQIQLLEKITEMIEAKPYAYLDYCLPWIEKYIDSRSISTYAEGKMLKLAIGNSLKNDSKRTVLSSATHLKARSLIDQLDMVLRGLSNNS